MSKLNWKWMLKGQKPANVLQVEDKLNLKLIFNKFYYCFASFQPYFYGFAIVLIDIHHLANDRKSPILFLLKFRRMTDVS